MHRHKLVQYSLGLGVGLVLVLWLLLRRLGLGPLSAYLGSINAVTFVVYGYDKRRAMAGGTRVPEPALHMAALVGGTPAAALAQALFRHKTRKRRFRLVFAGIILLQIGLACVYWRLRRA